MELVTEMEVTEIKAKVDAVARKHNWKSYDNQSMEAQDLNIYLFVDEKEMTLMVVAILERQGLNLHLVLLKLLFVHCFPFVVDLQEEKVDVIDEKLAVMLAVAYFEFFKG